jgi:putative transposase
MQEYPQEWPFFVTATIQKWKKLLERDTYKDIIIGALQFLVAQNKATVYGFVIMNNHVHIIWQAKGSHKIKDIQNSFIKHTSKQLKQQAEKDNLIEDFEVNKPDRKYNFWKRDSLSIELFTQPVFMQKLNYIHYNPVKAGLTLLPEDYHYSSALFYEKGVDDFNMLTHYLG